MAYQRKVIFYIRDGFGYGFGVSTIYLLPVPYPCFEIGENPNPVKTGKTRQVGFGSGG